MFKTAVTETYGTSLPVIAGGLMWLADAHYVAACAKAGIVSFITAASFPELEDLRAEIRKARSLCGDLPFGVNVSMLPKLVQGEKTRDVFQLIADEGVKFVETSGRNPEEFMAIMKPAGIHVLHKVPAVRYAVKAQSIGADMVAIVGVECGGHPGMDMIGTIVNAAMAERDLTIPFVIGGGIGTGSQVVAALAMGASGVIMGTRLLVAQEIATHENIKRKMVEASERDTALTLSSLRNTIRTLRNETTDAVLNLEKEKPDITIADLMHLVSGKIGREAYRTGDWSKGLLSAGHALAFADRIEPMSAIMARIAAEAETALNRLTSATQH